MALTNALTLSGYVRRMVLMKTKIKQECIQITITFRIQNNRRRRAAQDVCYDGKAHTGQNACKNVFQGEVTNGKASLPR